MGKKQFIIILILVAGVYACNKNMVNTFRGFQKPSYFSEPVYHFGTNPVTKEGFELGRKLFFDPVLSANNTISCGSCHIPTSAFTHHGHSVSHGIFDRVGTRNSPPIMNLAWSKTFMWDGGVFDLDLQPIAPITNHVEMDNNIAAILAKLQNSSSYPSLFKQAFGSDEITGSNFFRALSQFMVMCVSNNSKYDSVMRQQATFTADEQGGYLFYQQKCSSCHPEPLFTDYSFRNNGLAISTVNDAGRYNVTLQDTDRYKFKVPSLRNLDYSSPYMHDGRFFTVEAVLAHYGGQVQHTPNLDSSLQHGIYINAESKMQLLAFLRTLNDKTFVTDRRFAEPTPVR